MSDRFKFVNMFDKQRQKPIAGRVPEIEHAVAVADEAAAEHDVGLVFDDRLDQLRVFAGIVFQVGVLNHDHVAARVREAGLERRALCLGLFRATRA